MAPPDATPKSLFPGAATPAAAAAPGAFALPETLEFPMVTDLDGAHMSAFGNRVQSDHDADLLDARVSHVRDVRYGPDSPPPYAPPAEVSRVEVSAVKVSAVDVTPVIFVSSPLTPRDEHPWRTPVLVFLAVFAVIFLAGLGVVFLTR